MRNPKVLQEPVVRSVAVGGSLEQPQAEGQARRRCRRPKELAVGEAQRLPARRDSAEHPDIGLASVAQAFADRESAARLRGTAAVEPEAAADTPAGRKRADRTAAAAEAHTAAGRIAACRAADVVVVDIAVAGIAVRRASVRPASAHRSHLDTPPDLETAERRDTERPVVAARHKTRLGIAADLDTAAEDTRRDKRARRIAAERRALAEGIAAADTGHPDTAYPAVADTGLEGARRASLAAPRIAAADRMGAGRDCLSREAVGEPPCDDTSP